MEKKKLSKEERIKKEKRRLEGIFKTIDGNMLKVVQSLIENAAYMTVSIQDLQEIINEQGYTSEYQNGENQHGTKQSEEVKTYLAMSKNHLAVIAKLCDLVPPAQKKESKLAALRGD